MINDRKELKRILSLEKKMYFKSPVDWLEAWMVSDKDWLIYRFQRYLRLSEYHYNNKHNVLHRILYVYYRRKKNKLGTFLGIEIWENSFDEGLRIFHAGHIVVNGFAKIGKNCCLRGDNCIGNTGYSSKAPVIGDNVQLGNGARIIGDVKIANDVVIGAGAVVNKSFEEDGSVLVGVPARNIARGMK